MLSFFKRQKPFDYPNYDPPFKSKPLFELTDEEAQTRFEWFIGQSESRRRLLIDCIQATSGRGADCDYTPQSLVPLWRAISKFFEKRPMTPEEKEALLQDAPAAARQLNIEPYQLTTATLCLGLDIGLYVAEVFMRNYPQVGWMLWKGKDRAFNKAALSGFKLPLIPTDLVIGSMWKHFETPRETLLLEPYKVWEKDLL